MTHSTLQHMPSPECKFLILFYNAALKQRHTDILTSGYSDENMLRNEGINYQT